MKYKHKKSKLPDIVNHEFFQKTNPTFPYKPNLS